VITKIYFTLTETDVTMLGALGTDAVKKQWLQNTIQLAYAEWMQLTKNLPKSKAGPYKNGASVEQGNENTASLVLAGSFPLMIEDGNPETWMGEWLLGPNSKKRRKAKDGSWYNIIPFKHGGATNERNKTMMNDIIESGIPAKQAKNLASILKKEIKRQLVGGTTASKIKKASVQMTNKRVNWGARLNLSGSTSFMKSRYHGMVRTQKTYEQKSEGSFMTFRVISEKGRGTGTWMYPAKPGAKLMDKVAEFIDQNAHKWFEDVLREMGK